MLKLNNATVGSYVKVEDVYALELVREKLIAYGLTKGTKVEVIRKGPSGDPTVYGVRGTMIALRKEDAAKILVSKL